MAFSFEPIVEFFPTDWGKTNGHFLDGSEEHQKRLIDLLRKAQGIYSFYNSEYEIIYLGMTKGQNLWTEACTTFGGRPFGQYERYFVSHPRDQFVETRSGKVRPIQRKNVNLRDAAAFFSAYRIEDLESIKSVEQLLIRMLPNDLLNLRMEGNQTLETFKG